jgi:uncharacterized protein
MNKKIFIILLPLVLIIITLMNIKETTTIKINDIIMQVEISKTSKSHARGLSGRNSLDYNQGMLFIFKDPIIPSFWMKDMNFPIDIVWIDTNNTIVGIEHGLSPKSFPEIFSPLVPIFYVLEVNAGWTKENDVNVGDRLEL